MLYPATEDSLFKESKSAIYQWPLKKSNISHSFFLYKFEIVSEKQTKIST